ncbi:Cullin binding-domain-containing protein, partial [Coniochaeta sp. 2T2.1]
MMNYFSTLGVNPETCVIFVVLEIVQATSFGKITRKGFVDGWKATGVSPSITAHKKHIAACTKSLSSDPAYFKKVYRFAFTAGKEPDQKALALDTALVYWEMFFSPPGMAWKSGGTDWFEAWKRFLGEKWKRSVNKDMWNQTLEFALRTLEDGTLGFWSEDAAWPGVIDEFVVWWREKGEKEGMDV